MNMPKKEYITIPQLAKLLGVSRIAIYKRVKKGEIPATKVGRMYVITDQMINEILTEDLTPARKKQIEAAVKKTVKDYGEVLRRLGSE
jgi:excisionase family DNA binding protein